MTTPIPLPDTSATPATISGEWGLRALVMVLLVWLGWVQRGAEAQDADPSADTAEQPADDAFRPATNASGVAEGQRAHRVNRVESSRPGPMPGSTSTPRSPAPDPATSARRLAGATAVGATAAYVVGKRLGRR